MSGWQIAGVLGLAVLVIAQNAVMAQMYMEGETLGRKVVVASGILAASLLVVAVVVGLSMMVAGQWP